MCPDRYSEYIDILGLKFKRRKNTQIINKNANFVNFLRFHKFYGQPFVYNMLHNLGIRILRMEEIFHSR